MGKHFKSSSLSNAGPPLNTIPESKEGGRPIRHDEESRAPGPVVLEGVCDEEPLLEVGEVTGGGFSFGNDPFELAFA